MRYFPLGAIYSLCQVVLEQKSISLAHFYNGVLAYAAYLHFVRHVHQVSAGRFVGWLNYYYLPFGVVPSSSVIALESSPYFFHLR